MTSNPSITPEPDSEHDDQQLRALAIQVAARKSREERVSKASALVVTLIIHAIAIVVLALWILPGLQVDVPQIQAKTIGTSEIQTLAEVPQATVRSKPSAPSSSARLITTASSTASFFVPTVNVPTTAVDIGTGTSLGMGFGSAGFGSGMGGDVSFFGQSTKANRVVFIIDSSQSMRASGSNKLMIKELTKTLGLLKSGTDYGIIFFSGPVWQIGDKVSDPKVELRGERVVTSPDGRKLFWSQKGGDPFTWKVKGGRLPDMKWHKAGSSGVEEHIRAIKAVPTIGGTDLRHPFEMAFKALPKADTIFFLTDAQKHSQARQRVKDIAEEANKGIKKIPVNCIVMMESQALPHIKALAVDTSGMLSFVQANGKLKEIIKAKK